MPFSFEVTVPDDLIGNWAAAMGGAGQGWLETFGRDMIERTQETFSALAHGGAYRGVTWPPFRRRPSRKRGGWSARLLDDTGRLKSSIGEIFGIDENRLTLGTAVPYAARQQNMRPFLFFQASQDLAAAAQIAAEFIQKALAGVDVSAGQGVKTK